MTTQWKGLTCVMAAGSIVSAMVLTSTAVSGHSQISSRALRGERRAQHPDPGCFDSTNRYVNCGNGTVTDTATGLIWLQDAGCLGPLSWSGANQAAVALEHGQCGLADHSKPGDWRLPTNAEWRATVDAAKNHPLLQCTNPALTDDSGSACFGSGGASSFFNVALDGYWSSTTNSQSSGLLPDGSKAGTIPLSNGVLESFFDKSCCPQGVWPVRVR
jgi:Protein of unknown function (DUF1566)